MTATGPAGEPLSGLVIKMAGHHRAACRHRSEAGRAGAENEHFTGVQQAVADSCGLTGEAGREPPYHGRGPGALRPGLIGGEQPF